MGHTDLFICGLQQRFCDLASNCCGIYKWHNANIAGDPACRTDVPLVDFFR